MSWRIPLDQDLLDTLAAIYPDWFKEKERPERPAAMAEARPQHSPPGPHGPPGPPGGPSPHPPQSPHGPSGPVPSPPKAEVDDTPLHKAMDRNKECEYTDRLCSELGVAGRGAARASSVACRPRPPGRSRAARRECGRQPRQPRQPEYMGAQTLTLGPGSLGGGEDGGRGRRQDEAVDSVGGVRLGPAVRPCVGRQAAPRQ